MAQDLLKISKEAFELQLFKMSNSALIQVLKDIYEFKWEKGKNFSEEIIKDIERKETCINRELMNRKYLNQKDYNDYFAWLNKINFKKRVF